MPIRNTLLSTKLGARIIVAIVLASLLLFLFGCRRGSRDPAVLAERAADIRNVHLAGRSWLEDPSQSDPRRRGLGWEQSRLEVWILEGRHRLDASERDGHRIVRLFEPRREYTLQLFPPLPDLPSRPPEGYALPAVDEPDLWAVLLQAGQRWASPLPPVRSWARLVPAAAPAPFPHHPAPLAWFDLRPAGDGFPSDLTEYRRLRLGLGPEDGLLHAWIGDFTENPKESNPQVLWRVVVFDHHETDRVRPADLSLPPEAADAAWTDGQGRLIPAPRFCIQGR